MYTFATKPANAIKEARGKIKDLLGANNEKEIFFTSCGSESANMAIKGALNCAKEKKHIITTKVEHPCVLNTYKEFEKQTWKASKYMFDTIGSLYEKKSVINALFCQYRIVLINVFVLLRI